MTTTNTTPSAITETTRQRLALQLMGAVVNPDDAIQAAARLEPHLEVPNILEFVMPPAGEPRATLLLPSEYPTPSETPTALYRALPNLAMVDLPHEWLLPFLGWGNRHRRWQQFQRCKKLIARAGEKAPKLDNLPSKDSIVAGLVMYMTNPAAGTPLRRQLMALAINHPLGAFLATESHHFPDEVPALASALQVHSRLLHHVSQYPHFRKLCVSKAQADHSLWAGLILARDPQNAEVLNTWLLRVAGAACYTPAAALAALVLLPNAPEDQHVLWRSTLQNSSAARWAFEAAWWSRHTWRPERWERLKNELRPFATGDRGAYWFNWSLIEDDWVYQDYLTNAGDPLWAVEYLYQRYNARQPLDDRPLRNQMVERLIENHGDAMATVVLRFLDALQSGKDIQ